MTDDEIDTSDIPPLDDAFFERAVKILPRVRVDRIDFIRARRFAHHILAEEWSKTNTSLVHDAFNISLIVCYCKPFSVRRDLEDRKEYRLNEQVEITGVLNEEEKKLHDRVKELRDKSVAHSDASSVLVKGFDYVKKPGFFKAELNLDRDEVELLKTMIDKWIKYLDERISQTKDYAFLTAPDAES